MWRMIGIAAISAAMSLAIEYQLKQQGIIKPQPQPVRQSQQVPPQYQPPGQQIVYRQRKMEPEYVIIEEVEVWE